MRFTLGYGSPQTPRWGYTWLDWCHLFVIVGLITLLPVCLGLILDSPYVLAGAALFAISGVVLGRCFPWRLSQMLIIAAILGAAVTVTLHLISSYQLVVVNESGQPIKQMQIICETGGISGVGFHGSVPVNGKLSTTFHDLGFTGQITVEGTLADGTTFNSTSWGPANYRITRIVINSKHEAVITQH